MQVNNQIMPRSRFDHFSSSGIKQSHRINNRYRDRAVSRTPTNKLKRTLQKSKKVRCLLHKYFQNTVPKSSRLHEYVNRRSDVYHRLISESCGTKKPAQNSSRQWLYLVYIRLRSAKHKKFAPLFIYIHGTGLKKLKYSPMQTLWVSNHIIS